MNCATSHRVRSCAKHHCSSVKSYTSLTSATSYCLAVMNGTTSRKNVRNCCLACCCSFAANPAVLLNNCFGCSTMNLNMISWLMTSLMNDQMMSCLN